MTLTTDLLKVWFGQFNAMYFGGKLPMPVIRLSKARTKLGTMRCRRVRRMLKWVYTDFSISISTYYDCTEREYQTTLLHEMIHYHIAYNNIPDTSAHGKVFHEIMNRLNHDYGWHITVSSKRRNLRPADGSVLTKMSTHLVLALILNDGTRMLSVVSPRWARHIDRQASMVGRIASHRWYMSTDCYFNNFAKVRSLRACKVSAEVYNAKTLAAQPLAIIPQSEP